MRVPEATGRRDSSWTVTEEIADDVTEPLVTEEERALSDEQSDQEPANGDAEVDEREQLQRLETG